MSGQEDFFLDAAEQARRQQFRMNRLQVYNWGTFCGLHDIVIADKGFLFVGRSGSGKSTLLDAIATLLTPPQWLSFNAAAREGERSRRDRNLVSYVRGAWGDRTDQDSGEIATHYLRRGTTWSALALTFANGEGRRVSLVHLYWLRGAGTASGDVRRHFLIAERDFDIAAELDGFDLDVRALKRRLTDADHFGDTFRPYGERFRRLLGIGSEQALKLLHKTQSAKNLGDLNVFLREFMLERPDTFEAADRLVSEFAELDAAHREVVTARRQVDTLRPARETHDTLQLIDRDIAGNEALLAGIDAFTEGLRIELLDEALRQRAARLRALAGEIGAQEERLATARQALRSLEAQHRERGGDRIEYLEAELQQAERARDTRLEARGRLQADCRELDWTPPDTAEAFAARVEEARQWLEAAQANEAAETERRDALRDKQKQLAMEFAEVRREIAVMERQPSNVPAHMLELRERIAGDLGWPESELPFVGELLQVHESAAEWQGAIERLLHGFALSLLVSEDRYATLAEYADATSLGGRLIYYRVPDRIPAGGVEPGPLSLFHKLEIRDTLFRPWLEAELLRRFDYACVDNLRDFRARERALTRAGQIRHGRTRHEKDDRFAIDDRRRWVLGFDNREKLALYQARAAKLGARIADLDRQLKAIEASRRQAFARLRACERIANLQWQDVDVASALDRLNDIQGQLATLREDNRELRELGEQLERQGRIVEAAEAELIERKTERETAQQEQRKLQDEREAAAGRLAAMPVLEAATRKELAARFDAGGRPALSRLDERRRKVERAINSEQTELRARRERCVRRIEQAFADFKREWPEAGADMDASLAAADDFFKLLARIEHDGLPRHEKRFFEMLREQSSENLAALNKRLSQARKDIHLRMGDVNEGLARAEFNPGTFLKIAVSDRHLSEVTDFKQAIGQVLHHAWQTDRQQAERRFLQLKELVDRLASQETAARRWRERVLDVRLHVEFIGRELDRETGKEVEIYRSGAGKSGGQREKLATTCLAAALRYQLGGSESGLPTHAAVVLDEAFGKADNEFTELAMRIFERFGFQMIVATPLKAVMTLEPFIGGACFVDITDRKHSATLAIEYDETARRLDLPRHVKELSA